MLTQKLTFLPYCWVCHQEFGHSVKKEDHHVIPQAYGGADGPQVRICDSHHTALHHIANRLYSRKSYHELLTPDQAINARLMYLATCVYNARLATENDPNKRQILLLTPTKEMLARLDRLKQANGDRISREKLIELAVKFLYERHFIN